MFGKNHTDESKKKMSENSKGHKMSTEARHKMSRAGKGRKKSEEHKEKIRQSNLGKKQPSCLGEKNHSCKGAIQQLDLNGNVLAEYIGTTDLFNAGFTIGVYSVLSGKQKTHRGYLWKRKA